MKVTLSWVARANKSALGGGYVNNLGRPRANKFALATLSRAIERTGVGVCGRWLAATAICLFLLPACRQPPAIGADVAVRIDGEEIAYGAFEAYLRSNFDADDPSLEGQVQNRLFDQFLDEQLLLRLAIERGLVEPGVDQRQAVEFLLRGQPRPDWTEAQLQAYYQAHVADFEHPEEVRLRQILVHDRADAEQARGALNDGEDFPQVAARFSQAPNAQLGGDQGRLSREDLPTAYADTIFDLDAGEVTGIVEADYGYHIFEVVARYPAEVAAFEDVAEEIRRTLDRQHVDETVEGFIQEARDRYNVTVFPDNFPFDYQGEYAHGAQETHD